MNLAYGVNVVNFLGPSLAVQAPCGPGPWIRLVASALRMWPVDPAWVCGPGSRTQLGLVDVAYELSLGFGPGCR